MPALTLDDSPVKSVTSDPGADQLRAANFFLRTALDQMTEGVIILQSGALMGLGPKILFGNARMFELVGADPHRGLRDRFVTQLVASQFEADDLLLALKGAERSGFSVWEGDLIRLHGTRSLRALWRIRAVKSSQGHVLNYTVYVAPLEGAAAVKAPEQAAPRAPSAGQAPQSEARRLRNDNLAAMARGIVHNINNLVCVISGHLSLAATQALGNTDLARHVGEALAATQRARQFTAQALRLAKDLPPKREATELAALVRETARVAQSGSGVLIHLNLPKDLWVAVIDAAQISQVLQNLIINGIQAMQGAGHMDVLARNVELAEQSGRLAPGRYVEVCVRDRGCGMTQATLQRLFLEPFTTKPNGNGIGLTTCRDFIDEHHGDIRVSSAPNIGTEFTFYLPASDNRPVEVETRPVGADLITGAGTVMVCDDELSLRKITAAILKRCGYRVYEASSGEEAVCCFQQLMRSGDEIDAVIMDLTLRGGINGEEAMREILAINPEAKVIASSGDLVEESRKGYLAKGFSDILPKPYEAHDIAMVIHRVLTANRLKTPTAGRPALAAA